MCGSGLRLWGQTPYAQGSGLSSSTNGVGFRLQGLGFRVEGFGCGLGLAYKKTETGSVERFSHRFAINRIKQFQSQGCSTRIANLSCVSPSQEIRSRNFCMSIRNTTGNVPKIYISGSFVRIHAKRRQWLITLSPDIRQDRFFFNLINVCIDIC